MTSLWFTNKHQQILDHSRKTFHGRGGTKSRYCHGMWGFLLNYDKKLKSCQSQAYKGIDSNSVAGNIFIRVYITNAAKIAALRLLAQFI